MNRRVLSIAAALALCLSLLPGTVWAVDEVGVTFANRETNATLTDGKFYVAAAENQGIEKVDTAPEDGAYLEYNNGTLTVHGAFETTATITVNSNLTITGGADSSLNVTAPYGDTISLGNGSVLTLDDSVDFIANDNSGHVITVSQDSTGTFAAADSYSGDIVINSTSSNASAVYGVPMDVKNSGSITIKGMMTSMQSAVLNSVGNVSITSSGSIAPVELTIKGEDVTLEQSTADSLVFSGNSLNIEAAGDVLITNKNGTVSTPAPALRGTTVISAGGVVTILSSGAPVRVRDDGDSASLTVKKAQNVTITGKSSSPDAFFSVPVTFEGCGNVAITDSGDGELLGTGGSIDSDVPVYLGGGTAYFEGEIWTVGGDSDIMAEVGNGVTTPTIYSAGGGWIFYEPPETEGGAVTLTLSGAKRQDERLSLEVAGDSIQVVLKGANDIKGLDMSEAAVTLTGSGGFTGNIQAKGFTNNSTGTLNAAVCVAEDVENGPFNFIVYGDRSTSDIARGMLMVTDTSSLEIADGAALTVDETDLAIEDFGSLINNGTIVNNGTVTLKGAAAQGNAAQTIKSLNLAGTGTVAVEKTGDGGTVTENYTNSGTKLLAPAGELDLSSTEASDANWTTQGYKWEVTKGTDDSGNEIITSAKLTLAPGFNAEEVILPDTTVTIETTGESRIDELVGYDISGSGPQKTELTFSGKGPLTVDERINLAGGAGNTITVAKDAQVTANNGIYVGATGESSVTVNGILKAAGFTDNLGNSPAVSAGKVEVSNTGVLDVSGAAGVLLNGMSGVFTNLFTVTGDGRFTADCSEYNIQVVATNANVYPKDDAGNPDASKVIVLDDEYMPDDCEIKFSDDGEKVNLIRKSTGKVYTDALTIHKNHTWETGWTWDATTHWHACEFAGCTEKQPGSEATHFYRSCVCTVCGYQAPAGTPDSSGGSSSGGDSGSSSGGDSGSSSGGDSDSSSSDSSHETTYTVTVEKAEHGKVVSDHRTAPQGRTVTLTVSPDEGYDTGTLTVTDRNGKTLDVTDKGSGTYTFIMPGSSVSVRVVFNKITADYESCARDSSCPIWPFTDADTNAWYHDGVHYCLDNGLMNGYGDNLFGPDDPLSRAQFAQILYNREGRPAVNYLMQFLDVSGKEWYAEAVRWAASEGVVFGYGNGVFGPDNNITREQLALMLWRYAGSPAAAGGTLAFTDADAVSEYALEALRWAVENGIVTGRGSGVLDPQGQATRAEAAAMLMRYLGK